MTDTEQDTEAPVAPSGLSAQWKGNRVALSWTANAEQDVLGYNVYRREESEELGQFELIVTIVSGVEYVDGGAIEEKQYGYRITAVDGSGNESMPSSVAVNLSDMEVRALPEEYGLDPNFPNPFNSTTWVRYQLPAEGEVTLSIYNMLGQVRTLIEAHQGAGFYHTRWDGRDGAGKALASGIYFCRLQVGNFAQTRSMVILQ
ncbi:MAG: T9SS type A sorting domain-containing protein [Candidatus Latescibacteria bacterium]|nr:T9SS type A sorting domain-containing protein [Candidatus Latescibacterota bacterium]